MTNKQKLLITELKRIQEIMGVKDNRPLLTEQKGLIAALRDIFSSGGIDAGGKVYGLKYAGKNLGVNLPKDVYENLSTLISNPRFTLSDITDAGLRATVKSLVQNSTELSALAEDTILSIAKSQDKTVAQLMKELAQDYVGPTAENMTPNEFIKQKLRSLKVQALNSQGQPVEQLIDIDDLALEFVENYLVQQLKKYVPEVTVAGEKIIAAEGKSFWETGLGSQFKMLLNAAFPYKFKEIWFKFFPWAVDVLPNKLLGIHFKWLKDKVPSMVEALKKQTSIIMKKQQALDSKGQPVPYQILENLDNIWAIISRERKSMLESQYKQLIKDWLVTNSAIPKAELDVFLAQPGVKKVLDTVPEYLDDKFTYMAKIYLKAYIKSIPIAGAAIQASYRSLKDWSFAPFAKQNWLEWAPRLKNEILVKSPLTKQEMMELGMRNTKWGTIGEYLFVLAIWDTFIKSLVFNYVATLYQNYKVIKNMNERIERVRELCKVGLIQIDGKNVDPTQCDEKFPDIKRTNWEGFLENTKVNNPFSTYVREVKEAAGEDDLGLGYIPNLFWEVALDPFTRTDEFYDIIKRSVDDKENLIPWERWKDQVENGFKTKKEDIEQKLKDLGLPVDDEAKLNAAIEKLIRDKKKENPEFGFSGNYKNDLDGFKKFLTLPPNNYTISDLNNAGEKTDDIGKYYLIDKDKTIDDYDNPKFRFYQGTFIRG